MLDYSAEEVLGRSSLDVVHPYHAAFLRQRTESRLLGEEDELVRRSVADRLMLLFEKPFSPATLNCRVREALARGCSGRCLVSCRSRAAMPAETLTVVCRRVSRDSDGAPQVPTTIDAGGQRCP
jgi:hypothetical protein